MAHTDKQTHMSALWLNRPVGTNSIKNILDPPKKIVEIKKKNLYVIGATIHIGSEIQFLSYEGNFLSPDPDSGSYTFSPSQNWGLKI